jgi:mRNA interferase MazF
MVRGEVFRLPAPRATRGHEQRGARYALIVQADEFLDLSTTLVAPTSTSAMPASFRPTIHLQGEDTAVLVEQTTVVDPQRLGRSVGRLTSSELQAVTTRSRSSSASDANPKRSVFAESRPRRSSAQDLGSPATAPDEFPSLSRSLDRTP